MVKMRSALILSNSVAYGFWPGLWDALGGDNGK